jgi:hypothetical protein
MLPDVFFCGFRPGTIEEPGEIADTANSIGVRNE